MRLSKTIAATGVAALALGLTLVSSPASATTCDFKSLIVNTGDSHLLIFNPDGTVEHDVTTPRTYGDIAYDGNTGKTYGNEMGGDWFEIDIDSGAELRSFTPGAGVGTNFTNALSVRADGLLVTSVGSDVYTVDPSNGNTNVIFDMNLIQDENGVVGGSWGSAGDFITMTNGDLLGLLNSSVIGGGTVLVRISGNTGTVVGTVPSSWGGGRAGSTVYFAGSDGVLRSTTSIPTTASSAALTTTVLHDSQGATSYYGAAGTEDAVTSICSVAAQRGVLDEQKTTVAETLPDTSGAGSLGWIGAALAVVFAGAASIWVAKRKRA